MIRRTKTRSSLVLLAVAALLSGCEAGYYWQAVTGHTRLMQRTRPVADVIADAGTPVARRDQLHHAQAAVDFAHARLALPDNGSYRRFAELDAPYVVWNVVAAPALSLTPRTWCFPVAGCVSYRGYFTPDKAEAYAATLAANGDDVIVSGAIAYSTLGRFSDPLLSPMLDGPADRVAGIVFHELAHQRLYVADDSAFNEGFASFVAQEGVLRWLRERGDRQVLCSGAVRQARQRELSRLLATFRAALATVYAQPADEASKRAAKRALLDTLPVAYRRLRAGWDGPPDFDHWFAAPFNNARFALLTTYDDTVPAFAALLALAGGDLAQFYRLADELAAKPVGQRRQRLEALKFVAPEPSHPPGCDASISAT